VAFVAKAHSLLEPSDSALGIDTQNLVMFSYFMYVDKSYFLISLLTWIFRINGEWIPYDALRLLEIWGYSGDGEDGDEPPALVPLSEDDNTFPCCAHCLVCYPPPALFKAKL
jgi:hypothetical protein